MRSSLGILIAAAALIADSQALAGPVETEHAGGNTYVSAANSNIDAPIGAVGNLECPEKVSGGGFSQTAFAGELKSAYPSDPGRWTAQVDFEGAGQNQTLTTFAICNKGKRSTENKPVNVAPMSDKTVKAKCPTNKHVMGGGAH